MYYRNNIASKAISIFCVLSFIVSTIAAPHIALAKTTTYSHSEKKYQGYLHASEIERTTLKENPAHGLVMNTSYRFVDDAGESVAFIPRSAITMEGPIARVTLRGYMDGEMLIGDVVAIETSKETAGHASNPTANSKFFLDGEPEYSMAVFLVNYTDTVTNPFDSETAHERIFNGNFAHFFEEQSFGKATIDGDVFGWVTENKDSTTCVPMTYIPYNSALAEYITDHDIDLTNDYDFTFVIQNCADYVGFAGITSGTFGSSVGNDWWYGEDVAWSAYQPFPWTPLDRVLTHETGHMFGLGHANGLECGLVLGTEENIDACTRYEYANSFDTMGTSEYGLHFTGHAKNHLGWIPDEDVLTITESGTYTIAPIEKSTGTRLVKLSSYSEGTLIETPYLIDIRQGVGFDGALANFTGGLNVYRNTENYYIDLLDLHPTNLSWGQDVQVWALGTDEVFTDPYYGLVISNVVIHEDGSSTFDITLENEVCKNAPGITLNELTRSLWEKNGTAFDQIDGTTAKIKTTSITITTSKLDAQIGGIEALFKIQNTNNMTCGAQSFSIASTTSNPMIQYNDEVIYKSGYKQSVKISSGGKTSFETTVLIPSTITAGTYELTVTTKNNASGVVSEPYVLSITIIDDNNDNKHSKTLHTNSITAPQTPKAISGNTTNLYY